MLWYLKINQILFNFKYIAAFIIVFFSIEETGNIKEKVKGMLSFAGYFVLVSMLFFVFLKGLFLLSEKYRMIKIFRGFLFIAFIIFFLCLIIQLFLAVVNFNYDIKLQISGLLGAVIAISYFVNAQT